MKADLLDHYERASEWTNAKAAGAATKFDAATPCDEWDVRALMNHMLDTQHYFVHSAHGEDVAPPSPLPPELLSDDPIADFDRARAETLNTFSEPGVIEKTGPSLGIALATSSCTAGTWRRRRHRMRRCPKDSPRRRTT
jgi:hypothetical protein